MAGYKVYLKESVEKDLTGLPEGERRTIVQRIAGLSEDPRPACHEKLTGEERYRLRLGRWRIVYSIKDAEVTVWAVTVRQGKDLYR